MNETAKNRLLLLVIGFLLLTNIGMIIFCVMRPSCPPAPPNDKFKRTDGITDKLRKQLDFNEAQIKQVEEMRGDHHKRMRPLFTNMKTAKHDFYKLVGQPNLPDSVWRQAANRIGEAQKAIDMELFAHFQKMRTICTPEQQPKYDSLVLSVTNMMFMRKTGPPRGDSTAPKSDLSPR